MSEVLTSGTCFFCGKEVDSDFYCYGCREFVCADHLGWEGPGPHPVYEHDGDTEDDD